LVGGRYLRFGLELEFREENIDEFRRDFGRCHVVAQHIIEEWIERDQDDANWMHLGDALHEIGAGLEYITNKFSRSK